jgi:hypothetical protein
MKDELQNIWQKTVVAYSRYYPGICLLRLRKATKQFRPNGLCPGRDSNPAFAEYEYCVLPPHHLNPSVKYSVEFVHGFAISNDLLTSWGRVLEKPKVAQPLKKCLKFCGASRLIVVFTRARHWSLSWARWVQSISHPSIYLMLTLILSSHLYLEIFLVVCFFLVLPPRLCMHSSSHPRPLNLILIDTYSWRGLQVMKVLIMQFFQTRIISSFLLPNIFPSSLFWNTLNYFLTLL